MTRKASPSRRPARDERQSAQRSRPARPKRRKKGKMGRVLDAFLGPFGFHPDGVDDDAPPPRRTRGQHDPHHAISQSRAPKSHPREPYPREPFPRESFPRESFARDPAFASPPIAGGDSGSLRNSQANARPARGPIIASDDPSLINTPKLARKPAPEPMRKPAPELMSRPVPEPMPRSAPEVLLADDKRPQLRIEAPQLAPPGSVPAVIARTFRGADGRHRAQRPDRRGCIPRQSRRLGRRSRRTGREHHAAGRARLRARVAHRPAGADCRRWAGRRLDGAGAAVGRRRGAGQSGGSVQRQDDPASDRRRRRADPGQERHAGQCRRPAAAARRDAGAGQPPGGEQAARRSAGARSRD